jgi:hypothetical protein
MRFPILLALAALAGCADAPTGPDLAQLSPELRQTLAATARFSTFAQAEQAGYTFLFEGSCFSDPTEGAMGFHYVNPQLLDATIDALAPEAVLYEPQANGTFKLVGLEYVVPKPAWPGDAPPRLFGQDYSYNATFDLYTLHVWLYQANPAGMFVGWNTAVSCANAPASLIMEQHH